MSNVRKIAGLYLIFSIVFGLQTWAGAKTGSFQVIDPGELKILADVDMRNFLLVDARNPEEYWKAYIPGAVNIPQKKMDKFLRLLPTDKTTRIIYYCNGVKCGKSPKTAQRTMKLGYKNINQAIFADWKQGDLLRQG